MLNLNHIAGIIYQRLKSLGYLIEMDDSMDVASTIIESLKEKKPEGPFVSSIYGTSKLIRIKEKNIIMIAYRGSGESANMNYPDSVCISNDIREDFFADVKATRGFRTSPHKYVIYKSYDPEVYQHWSDFIDNEFKKGAD